MILTEVIFLCIAMLTHWPLAYLKDILENKLLIDAMGYLLWNCSQINVIEP